VPGSIEFGTVALRSNKVPRRMLRDLRGAEFKEIPGAGQGPDRMLVRPKFLGAVTMIGRLGDYVKHYQEREVTTATKAVTK